MEPVFIIVYFTIFFSITTFLTILFFWNINRKLEKIYKFKPVIEEKNNELSKLTEQDFYLSKRQLDLWIQANQNIKQIINQINSIEQQLKSFYWIPKFLQNILITQNRLDPEFKSNIDYLNELFLDPEKIRQNRNENFIENEFSKYDQYFNNVESNPLTTEQRRSIIVNEANNLVVAGAGTGKTSTLVGKTGYLLSKPQFTPDNLLLLSFANLPKLEMRTRISEKLGVKLETRTFHSLGKEILNKSFNETPQVAPFASDRIIFNDLIDNLLLNRMRDIGFANQINQYFIFYLHPGDNELDFQTEEEYEEYIRDIEIRTLNGEKVKSLAECDIANFLYMNQVEYQYEAPYPLEDPVREYHPDFYLFEDEIWIEHIGIDRQENTAPQVDREKYHEEWKWKKKIHQENNTTLIETYSYERSEGTLLQNLRGELESRKVSFKLLPKETMFEKLKEFGSFSQFSGFLAKFINLYKSNNKSFQELRNKAKQYKYSKRYLAFLDIFETIYKDYQEVLANENLIDFNDMINLAIENIKQGIYEPKFKYILVDEFQDISQSRYKLLKAILDAQDDSQLFCVGDDWQSIYRFTGSDLKIMTDYESHFPYSTTLYLTETFRFNEAIRDISSKFIQKNPEQYRKTISAQPTLNPGVSIIWYDNHDETLYQTLELIDKLEEETANIIVLSRYGKKFYDELTSTGWIFQNRSYQNNLHDYKVDVHITQSTVHSSKGTEADYIVLIGMKGNTWGFPCEIEDDPILGLVLASEDMYPNAEERRVFYVALTRAKKQAYVLADRRNISKFVSELVLDNPDIHMIGESPFYGLCPECGKGLIRKKIQAGKPKYQCNNQKCSYQPILCPECENGFLTLDITLNEYQCNNCNFSASKCPKCEGYLINHNDKFWRCSHSWTNKCNYKLFITSKDEHEKPDFTELVIEIPPKVKPEKAYSVQKIRQKHPNAYKKWTKQEDQQLINEYQKGYTIPEMMKAHKRQKGGIRSRLKKLDLSK